MQDDLHEARVKAFMEQAAGADPVRVADVCARYPVKTDAQLGHIARRELTVSDLDSLFDHNGDLYDDYGQYGERSGSSLPLTEEDRALHPVDWITALEGWRGLESA